MDLNLQEVTHLGRLCQGCAADTRLDKRCCCPVLPTPICRSDVAQPCLPGPSQSCERRAVAS